MFHKTQNKIILIMTVVALAMMVGLYLLEKTDREKITLLMSNQRKEKEALLDKIIELKSKGVGNFAYDYTYWDEMVDFVKNGSKVWAEENIEVSMPTFGVDMAWVYRTDLSIMYSANQIGADHLDRLPLSTDILEKIVSKGPVSHFFMLTDAGLIEIFGASIHPTFDEERKTPPRGYFFVGCLWTETYLEEMSKLSETHISLTSLENERPDAKEEDLKNFIITNTKALYGWDGTHIINVHAESESLIAKTLNEQSHVQYSVSIAFAIVLLVFLSFVLFWWINRPLSLLSRSFTHGNPDFITGLASQKNEFGNLSVLIREFFNQKNQLEQEIAERKRTEEVLLESEERYRTMIENSNDLIQSVAPDGRFLFVNPMWRHTLGYSETEVAGLNLFDVIHPDSLSHCRPLFEKIFNGENIPRIEVTFVSKDGRVIFLEGSATPRFLDRQVIATQSFFHDVTERKQTEKALRTSEEKYRTIFENVQDVYYETSSDGTIVEVSPSIEMMSRGHYHREDLIGKAMHEFYADEKDREALLSAMKETGKLTDFEVRLRNRDGSFVWCSISARMILSSEGQIEKIIGSMYDITERKRAEEALRESEKNYRELINGMNETVWVIDFDGDLIDVNNTAVEGLGYSKEELLKIGLYGIDSSLKKENIQALANSMPSDKVQIFETTHTAKDGRIFPVEVYSSLVTYQGKHAILSIARDITERKQAEETILKERALLRTLIDHLPVGIFVKDVEYKKIIVNPIHSNEVRGHLKYLGMNSEIDILNKTDFEVYPKELANKFFIEDQKVVQDGSFILNSEGLGFSEEGNPLWLLISKIPLRDNNNRIVGMVGVTADITERKRAEEMLRDSEERLSDIIYSVNDWVWEVDENGRYIYSSEKGRDLLGYPSEEIIGKTPFDFMPPDEAEKVKTTFSQIISNKAHIKDVENWNIRKDGEKICLLTNGVPILDENGNLAGYRGVDKDITERKRAEEKIQASLTEKELLLKEIHHRVKNNLQIIISLIRIQSRSVSDAVALKAFEESINRIHSMSQVHEQLYATDDFAHIVFKRYVEKIATFLISNYNMSSRISLELDIRDVALAIDTAIPCGLIVNELLTNTLKYAFPDKQKGIIKISMRLINDKDYEFIFQDNGIGLADHSQESKTESFGMQLIKMLIQQIKGKMVLTGDEGTCYQITFPKGAK